MRSSCRTASLENSSILADCLSLFFSPPTTKSLKLWILHFKLVYDKNFITSWIGKLAIIYNCCPTSTKNRLLSIDIGVQAKEDTNDYKELLQIISVLHYCPNHTETALQQLYQGVQQVPGETVAAYLEKFWEIWEDSYGPANRWIPNQALLVVSKILAGLKDKNLSMLSSSYVVRTRFDFTAFMGYHYPDPATITSYTNVGKHNWNHAMFPMQWKPYGKALSCEKML